MLRGGGILMGQLSARWSGESPRESQMQDEANDKQPCGWGPTHQSEPSGSYWRVSELLGDCLAAEYAASRRLPCGRSAHLPPRR